jgi:hypothetical protein
MKRAPLVAPCLFAVALSGCGILYTNVRVPRAYRTAVPSDVHATPEDPVVAGRACAYSVLYLVAWGDSGYAAAARDALKSQPAGYLLYDVKTDVQASGVLLGLYARSCTHLTGRAAKP